MKKLWRYWRWVRLTLDGQRQVQELSPCREWMKQKGLDSEFEELLNLDGRSQFCGAITKFIGAIAFQSALILVPNSQLRMIQTCPLIDRAVKLRP